MASTLASIGRARPSQAVKDIIQTKLAMNADERRSALAESELAFNRERMMHLKNQREYMAQEQAYMNEYLPVDSLLDAAPGGGQGRVAQYLLKNAMAMGYVNKDLPGMGGIRRQDAIAMGKWMQDPTIAKQINAELIQDSITRKNELMALAQEKPNDKNIQAQLQEADAAYQTYYKMHPQVVELEKEHLKQKAAADKLAEESRQKMLDRQSRERVAKTRATVKEGPEGYNKSLSNAISSITDENKDPSAVFAELRKNFPSKIKELIAIEKGLKEIAGLPEDLQTALEVNAEAINAGELDAVEVARKLGGDWPDHSKVINRVLLHSEGQQDLAEALRTIFE